MYPAGETVAIIVRARLSMEGLTAKEHEKARKKN
jgi:hypothetical protein